MGRLNTQRQAIEVAAIAGADGARRPAASFEDAAAAVLESLQRALAEMLAAGPGPAHRARDVERAFGVDYRLAWQVFKIATAKNALSAGTNVPARVSMNKLLKAAAKRGVPEEIVQRVLEAFEGYERLVESDAGDRAAMDSMLSSLIPEGRDKHELGLKQAAFKSMSQIVGVAMEADIAAHFRFPSPDGKGVDIAVLQGHLGLRRVRPGAPICFVSGDVNKGATTPFTLDGEMAFGPGGPLLPEFCSKPLPRFAMREEGGLTFFTVMGEDVGLRSAVDLILADWRAGTGARYHEPGGKTHASLASFIDCPAKRLTCDQFVHKDLYPGVHPELAIYDVAKMGVVTNFNDPAREHDRLQMHESIRSLGWGFGQARLTDVPRYLEMLEYVCQKLGWNPSDFRGYRLDVQYPVYGVEYLTGFRMPVRG